MHKRSGVAAALPAILANSGSASAGREPQAYNSRFRKHAAQIAGVVAVARDERARLKAPCLERRRQAVIRNGNAAFVAPGPHGLKEIVEPERNHR
jgi:hypothetical protein